ncbi:sulfite exporter TauE/SafE family protein [Pokkaliibacter sp. CJK22405]|uniref:sulfite exporter TauE/SafE family protein n=1 Tax=Pokkaliibacter sp. CJK22405 TaxID=3384615 RepID=UPI0039851978
MAEWLPVILGLLATGVVAGILAGLLGVGGGIVIVPVLFWMFQHLGISPATAMSVATATSLATIVPTSISSIRSHHRRGNVDVELLKRWAPGIVLGVILGAVVSTRINGHWLTLMFGVIAVLVALNMLFRAKAKPLADTLPSVWGQRVLGLIVGGLSVMIGIGGGTLGVPLLTAFNVAAHRAVGTAAAFGLLIALPGVITMLVTGVSPTDAPVGTWGLVNFPGLILIVPLTVLCAPLGVAIGQRLDQAMLKKIFAVALMITGVRMLIQVLG